MRKTKLSGGLVAALAASMLMAPSAGAHHLSNLSPGAACHDIAQLGILPEPLPKNFQGICASTVARSRSEVHTVGELLDRVLDALP